jgi:hypothetical protein
MNQIKLIVSDLDGTIIPEGRKDLEEGFTDVLKQLLDRGIDFIAASGRPYSSMKTLFDGFVDRIGFLCENGALVMEGGEISLLKTLPPDLARAVANDLISNPNISVQLSGVGVSYLVPRTDWFVDYMKNTVKNNVTVVNSFDEIPEPVLKIAGRIDDFERNAAPIREEMLRKYGEYANFVYAGNDFLDLILKHTGKGYTLKELMERKGLRPDEVLVFGDNENDISMLALTPNSYAKTNSAENVKAIASYECDSVVSTLRGLFSLP